LINRESCAFMAAKESEYASCLAAPHPRPAQDEGETHRLEAKNHSTVLVDPAAFESSAKADLPLESFCCVDETSIVNVPLMPHCWTPLPQRPCCWWVM